MSHARMKQDLHDLNLWPVAENDKHLLFGTDPYEPIKDAHSAAVITEWDEFKTYDWQRIYENM